MKLFISPHNDDETLWGAFTLLREHPHVIVCLRSRVQMRYGITHQQREAETAAAMEILGCTWDQWRFLDDKPPWGEIEHELRLLRPEKVWVPCPEIGGQEHHNRIGEMALRIWPNAVKYMTYTTHGRSTSADMVPFGPLLVDAKLRALQCYRSQIMEPSTSEHFIRDLREYYA